jgi:flavodoxin II
MAQRISSDFGELQEDWEAVWDQLDALNLDGKIIALYGMGDQLGYGEWFLDALGMLHDKLVGKGYMAFHNPANHAGIR